MKKLLTVACFALVSVILAGSPAQAGQISKPGTVMAKRKHHRHHKHHHHKHHKKS